MPTLKNVRHEKFCRGVASGLSHSESYRRICGNNRNADVHGAERMKRPGVRERVAELQKEHDSKSKLSREEALEWLSNLIRTPIGSVGKDSPLVQAYEEDSEGKVKVRLADKIAAMQTLCRMTGWNEPDQVSLSGTDTLSAYLLELRAQPISGPILPLERHQLSLENGENVLGGR